MAPATGQKIAYLICFAVISISVTGYFIGLKAPMNPAFQINGNSPSNQASPLGRGGDDAIDVIPSTVYSQMSKVTQQKRRKRKTRLADLKTTSDPMAEVKIGSGQKAFALAIRESNRAFNGAPPTIPHPIDPISTESCVACHTEGFKSESLRIPKMSHPVMANCTQCHVESAPLQIPALSFRSNSFDGLAAPTAGPRAFMGAPPQIPHSTWMRINCNSCHGPTGLQGIRTTHPWRTSCQQCHAPSSSLNQTDLVSPPRFIDPPALKQ